MSKFQAKNFQASFKYALNGLALIYKSQRNIRIQILFALFAVLIAVLLRFNAVDFVILAILITLVLGAEMVNTVIEFILDSIYKRKYSRIARIAKDMSAGMVLFVTEIVVLCGIVLFAYKYYEFINEGVYYIWY